MHKCTCCGGCDNYDEWNNGYCSVKRIKVEPENESCEEYADDDMLYDLHDPQDI